MRSVSNEYIRVGRPEVSDSTLNGFVICGEDEVRRRIAESERATPELLATLSCDDSSSVRKAVAANVNAPSAVLMSLVEDKDPDVRFRWRKTTTCIRQFCKSWLVTKTPILAVGLRRLLSGLLRAVSR
jgi:hypothetical protein